MELLIMVICFFSTDDVRLADSSSSGGIVDASTVTRARKQGDDIFTHLVHRDTSPILQKLSDAIVTDHTGTNVKDLKAMLVS
jgi:glycerate-2-kinase